MKRLLRLVLLPPLAVGIFLTLSWPEAQASPSAAWAYEAANPSLPPVYLTIISHNEEPNGGRPDYTADRNFYLQNRNLVKMLAETITSRGATFNFQSDWNYLKAVAMYDVGSVTDDTADKNIVRWMREDLGVEVDPHAHETQYNYADVAYLIEQLGVTPSKNVGGFLYQPPDNPLDSLAPYVAQGRVRWVNLSQMADLWNTQYSSNPFRYDCASASPTPTPTPTPGSYTIEAIETWVNAPNGNQLYTRIVRPLPALYPGQRFPALITVPGGTGAGAPLADNPGYRNLAASGFVVIAFNAEGRGSGGAGNLRSQGTEDCNGFVHQDDLKAIVEYAAALPNVDARNIGVESSSFGIAIGAGALGRYPSLPVAYLVDQEGPHDNRVITFYDAGHETAVCGHLSTVSDPSPANVAFWAEREAVRYIDAYRGRYLRMQAEIDHAQNPYYFRHAIEMVNAATHSQYGGTGTALWTRVNGSELANPVNTVYPLGDPSQYPTWVSGCLADHPGLNFTYIHEMAALSATSASVGGIAELPNVAHGDTSTGTHIALVGLAALALLALTAGAWYARRRWLG